MGNAISASTNNYFYTSCMAKYTNITKPQVMAIRNLLVLISQQQQQQSGIHVDHYDGPMMIQRKHIRRAIQKVNLIKKDPDYEIIDLLFTMWLKYHHSTVDTNGIDTTDDDPLDVSTTFNGVVDVEEDDDDGPITAKTKTTTTCKKQMVPWYEFLISLSLLACKTDTLEQAIRFTLYVVHRNQLYHNAITANSTVTKTQQGCISSTDAYALLQGICTTATFYGDQHVLQSEQIHNIVDRIYDSVSKVPFESTIDDTDANSIVQQKELLFDEFVKSLLRQREIRDIVVLPISSKRIRKMNTTRKMQSKPTKNNQKKSVILEDESVPLTAIRSATKPSATSRQYESPMVVRKSAMKVKSMYDFNPILRNNDEPPPKSPRQNNSNNAINGKNNKYMPLIDEIERDARKKMKQGSGIVNKRVSSEPEPIATSSSSSSSPSSSSSSNDDINAMDPNSIHVTTTEEEDEDNSMQGHQNDQDDANDDTSEVKSVADENIKEDAILATLRANDIKKASASSKKGMSTTTTKSKLNKKSLKDQQSTPYQPPTNNTNHHQANYSYNHNNLYTMAALEPSETTVSPPSSVPSTDLSSHMSSTLLIPLARISISNNNNNGNTKGQ